MNATRRRAKRPHRLAEETSENLPRYIPLDPDQLPDATRKVLQRLAEKAAAPLPYPFKDFGQRPPAQTKRKAKHQPPVKRWRKPPPQKVIKGALAAILEATPTMSGELLETTLWERLGEGMTRQRVRAAIKQYAPETVRLRGRPRKNNSPK
jgi:hypothetical protein